MAVVIVGVGCYSATATDLSNVFLGQGDVKIARREGRVEFVFYLSDIAVQCIGVAACAERDDWDVCQVGCDQTEDLGNGLMVDEAWIAVFFHPGKAVVVAVVMIDGVLGVGVEADVEGGDSGEILEGCKVTPAPHGADCTAPYIQDTLSTCRLVGGLNGCSSCVDYVVENRGSRGLEVSSAGTNIDILVWRLAQFMTTGLQRNTYNICNIGLVQPWKILLDPFGRSNETILLAVP